MVSKQLKNRQAQLINKRQAIDRKLNRSSYSNDRQSVDKTQQKTMTNRKALTD
jgi:hypothetical protein